MNSRGGGALNDLPAPQVEAQEGAPSAGTEPEAASTDGGEPEALPTDGGEQDAAPTGTGDQNVILSGGGEADAAEGSPAAPAEDPGNETSAPAPADWREVAEAVESGELEGFRPEGSGAAADPYRIASPEALAWWALLRADSHARLEADLDLTGRDGEALPWPGDSALSGELDGQGHALAFATDGAGLFAEVAEGGAVRWLALGRTEAEARAAADAGRPAAEVASAGTLAGSVAGTNKGVIEGVVNRMPVGFSPDAPAAAERSAGGVAAVNDGEIRDCANLGAVSNDASAGDSAAAGIAARGAGTIAASYNAGDVKAARNAAYVTTLLDAEGGYEAVVDAAACYLAPGEGAAYEGVSDAGADRPGALTAAELAGAAERLNDGREGDAAAWQAGDDATDGFPAPSEPANPDAGIAPAVITDTTPVYTNWTDVAKAMNSNLNGMGALIPKEETVTWKDGATGTAFVIKTPEALAWFAYQVNTNNLTYWRKNVQLAADIDLSGFGYAGKGASTPGDQCVNCLPWIPIGSTSSLSYGGRFDGAGHLVSNVRMDASSDGSGFIGNLSMGTVERLGIASGYMNVVSESVHGVGTLVGECTGGDTNVRNCFSLVDIGGKDSASNNSIGGLIGSLEGTFENCYYAGAIAISGVDPCIAGAGNCTNVYFDATKNPGISSSSGVGKATTELQSAEMASLLNGGEGVWAVDWMNRNGGYPTVRRSGDPAAAPTSWKEVGKLVQDGAACMPAAPTEQPVTWGDGTPGQAYVIDSAEQLAWFSYMVSTENGTYGNKNVQLAADIDLSGFSYSGATEPGSDYSNCLKWLPINQYSGHFDGAGYQVKNVYIEGTPSASAGGYTTGFFEYTLKGCVIERLGLSSGCLKLVDSAVAMAGTLVGVLAYNEVIKDCYSLIDIGGALASGSSVGGLVGGHSSGSVKNSYYAGTMRVSIAKPCVGATNERKNLTNLHYDKDKVAGATDDNATGMTTAELKSAATVALLNGSAADSVWAIDAKNRNDGYPVVLRDGEAPVPTSWEAVGKQMEEGAEGMPAKPTEQAVTWSDGSTGQAFVIENAEQLAWFSYMVSADNGIYGSKNVQLAGSIDLAGQGYTGAETVAADYSNCLQWLPIGGGTANATYRGIFDGNGEVVRNLYVNQPAMMNMGLIGSATGSTVKGVGLESGRLVAKGYLGGLVGFTGGVVKVSNCWNAASIERAGTGVSEHAGGLVGGNDVAGGAAVHLEISRCYNKGSVRSENTAGDSGIGGIAGYTPGSSSITDCYNTGAVSGAHQAGGIVGGGGVTASGVSNYTRVTNCYNTGLVERGEQANGAVAAWRSIVSNCYTMQGSTERPQIVTGAPVKVDEAQLKSWGAAYALNGGNGVNSFADLSGAWRTDTASVNDGYPVPCKTGESLAAASTWNDVGLWVDGFAPGNKPTGKGTLADPYLIGNEQQLAWWAYKTSAENATFTGSHVKLTADINLIGTAFNGQTAVGGNYGNCLPWATASAFSGVFDGDGHTVSNLRMSRAFFSTVTGQIKNLTLGGGYNYGKEIAGFAHTLTGSGASLVNCVNKVSIVTFTNIYPNRSHMAGMVYRASAGALIDRCMNEGSCTISSVATAANNIGRVGGIVAELQGPSVVSNSCNKAALQANSACLGGIAGSMEAASRIESCFNVGSLTNRNSIVTFGDIVGTGAGAIKNCYASTGRSGNSSNADGSVKLKQLTAAQMQTLGFAINLNGNMSGAGTAWTWNAGDTYPTFGEVAEVDWLEIGGFVANDEGAFGSYKPAATGDAAETAAEISTPEALAWYGHQARQGTAPEFAKLTADIDLGGYVPGGKASWAPITGAGGERFAFTLFEGDNHSVKNMTVDNKLGEDAVGLFGSVSGSVSGIVVTDSTVDGGAACSDIGAIAGLVSGSLERCGATDTVSVTNTIAKNSMDLVGGLAGTVANGSMKDCFARASVITEDNGKLGGLVGHLAGSASVKSCYVDPQAYSGNGDYGSFVGYADGTTFERCYWPTDKPAYIKGTGCEAKTSLQLRSALTAFELNAGRTGADAPWTWSLLENGGYPTFGEPPADVDASTWGGIGRLQVEEKLRRTEAVIDDKGFGAMGTVHDAQPSDGDYTPALEGSGVDGDPYVVRTPEALAWWGYQVNRNNGGFTHDASGADTATEFEFSHVLVGAALDLAGLAYTGATEVGTNHANCLEWSPVSYFDGIAVEEIMYGGTFDGGGHPIANVRLVGKGSYTTAFFGDGESAPTLRRVLLASGTLDATGASAGHQAGTLLAYAPGGSVSGCASLVDIVGSADVGVAGSFGGLVGDTTGIAIENSYYGGTIDAASPAKPFLGTGGASYKPVNCYYAGDDADDPYATGVTADQLKSWGAAYALNGGDGSKALVDLKTWRAAADGENGGFPVPCADGESMSAASSWADVGKWVDAYASGKKPAGDGAAAGSGATGPYQIGSPEQLAWFAYKVNSDNAAFAAKDAVLTGSVDLFGGIYTGKALDESADLKAELGAKALRWAAIGEKSGYKGTFDGQGNAVRHLYSSADVSRAGLIGPLSGTVRDVAVDASSVSAASGINDAAGAVVSYIMGAATIKRCSVGKDVSVQAGKAGGIVGYINYGGTVSDCASRATVTGDQAGGIMGNSYNATIENCYFAGSAAEAMVGRNEGSSTFSNNYYQDGSAADDASAATKLSAADMTAGSGSSLAGKLNAGRTGGDAPWRFDSKDENDGYPVLVLAADIVSTWGEVGAAQDEARLRLTEAVVDPDTGFGTAGAVQATAPATPALSGSGVEGDPYVVRTPEALAWWGYQVNCNNRGFTHDAAGTKTATEFGYSHVLVGAALDLAGLAYVGATEAGLNRANCLEWSPVSYYDSVANEEIMYGGTFDGGGHPIENVRLVGRPGYTTGFFGNGESSPTLSRVLLASGALDATGASAGYQAGTLLAYAPAGSVTGCASLVDVVGSADVDETGSFGGLVGDTTGIAIENSYYAGTIDPKSPAKRFLGTSDGSSTPANCYYVGDDAADPYATGVTADQLKSWGAAYALNGGDGSEAIFTMASWRAAADGENGGFPVPCADGESMSAASDWSDVGAWVDVFATDRHPKAESATWRDGTAAEAYKIDTPEQLAWFAYKTKMDDAYLSKNVQITAELDLSGLQFTGQSEVGDRHANCLPWVAIGDMPWSSSDPWKEYHGRFDGAGQPISNLRIAASVDEFAGLLGMLGESSLVERVGIASGSLDVPEGINPRGTLAVYVDGGARIEDCYSRVDAFAASAVSRTEQGGLLGGLCDGSMENCYFAGTVAPELQGVMKPLVGLYEGGRAANLFYLASSGCEDDYVAGIADDELKSWGAAYQLNAPLNADGAQKALGDLKTWRPAADGENGGFPVLVKEGDAVSSMPAASDWGDVGLWVDAFESTVVDYPDFDDGVKPAHPVEVDAPESWGAAAGTKAFAIENADDLAWFAYKVNADNAAYGAKNAVLSANIDLFGGSYTGKAFDEAAADLDAHLKADALAWTSLGEWTDSGSTTHAFGGTLDGQGRTVSHLFTPASTFAGGLVGWATGEVSCVAIEASSVSALNSAGAVVAILKGSSASVRECSAGDDVRVQAEMAGGIASGASDNSAISDCFSRATVAGGDYYRPAGIVCDVSNASVENCYFTGTSDYGVVGSDEGGLTASNNYCQEGSSLVSGEPGSPTILSAADMTAGNGSSLAIRLNAGRTGTGAPWRLDSKGKNDGYPVLALAADIMSTWGDVGAMQDEGKLRRTEAVIDDKGFGTMGAVRDAQPSGGDYLSALSGSGTEADPYVVRTPEALAWWGYQVNSNNDGLTHDAAGADTATAFGSSHVLMGAAIDLAGLAYTAASEVGTSHENCLLWTPVGSYDASDGRSVAEFKGRFDGQGRTVENLLISCSGKQTGGLFGYAGASSAVERVGIASGAMVDIDRADGWGALVGLSYGEVSDCYSRVDLSNSSENYRPEGSGALIGAVEGGSVSRCYFAGANPVKHVVGRLNTGYFAGAADGTIADVYFAGAAADDPNATALTDDQLASWGAAYALNGGDGSKALGDLKTWRQAADGENGGFPVLLADDEIAAGEHMGAASDWSDVGAWVDVFAPGKKPAEVDAPASWNAAAGTKAYAIERPEQLAWILNTKGGSGSNALITKPIDLAGNVFTGKSGTGTEFDACLEWKSGAVIDSVLDGGGQLITNLYQRGSAAGLLAMVRDAKVRNVALASGLVSITTAPQPVGTLASYAIDSTVENCFSRVNLANGDSGVPSAGFLGQVTGSHVEGGYYAGSLAGNASGCFYLFSSDSTGSVYTDLSMASTASVQSLTTEELKSWRGAYLLNGESYVGKGSGASAVASTVWTVDDATAPQNGGYPVFGNLVPEEKTVEVDANDAMKSADGSIEVALPEALQGAVQLVEAPDESGLDGASLASAALVKDNFSTWGTVNANKKVALSAGTTELTSSTPVPADLATDGLASVTLNLAAAYDSAADRTASFVVVDDSKGYRVTVKIPAVTEKTLDVTAPVESGSSFELAPDGDVHENVMAKAPSEFKSNNALPVAGSVAKVEALAEGSAVRRADGSEAKVSAVLQPTGDKLAATPDPITDAGKVRLLAGASTGTGETAGLTPLAASLYYDPASGTVPLAFAVPGNGTAVWKWGMDYTGTYLEPDGVFGFSMQYGFGLPTADVPNAKLEARK